LKRRLLTERSRCTESRNSIVKHREEKLRNNPKSRKNQSPKFPSVVKKDDGLLNLMFKNKEQSLILLLVILLMEENTDPSVLLALMYLLM
jgi:hypothetical protein